MDLYAEIILDHYQHPHHAGTLEQPTISAEDSNPLCGDKIRLDLLLDQNGKIIDVGFVGEGCAISQASASMLTDELIGKTIEEAEQLQNEDIYAMVQVLLSPARVKCALLSLATLKKGVLNYRISHSK